MAVSWGDTPGSTLPSRSEEINFSTDRDVNSVRVVYEEEEAFNGSSFPSPYASSSKVGNVFALRRTGGWQKPFDVYVDEEPEPPPSGGQPLGALYTVDFTTLAGQSSFSNGAITVDGLTWYVKGALTGLPFGAVMQSDLTAGQGIRFQCTNSSAITMSPGAVSYPYRSLFLPFANVPGYNSAAPVAVRFRGVQTGWGGNNRGLVCGIVSSTNDGTDLAAADRQYDSLILTYESTFEQKRGTAGQGSATMGITADNRGVCVYRVLGESTIEARDPGTWSGSFPALDSVVFSSTLPLFTPGARSNPGALLCMIGQVSTSSVYFTHLQILQPKVAA